MKDSTPKWMVLSLAMACLGACGGQDDSTGAAGPGAGVGQGGAQDFGQFRQILDDGDIPHPETLDDIGFFNEHHVEFPAADCGASVCLHGQLGVMGNMITGSNCTLISLGMNTPLDPSTLDRPPLNLAIAVDTSGSMAGDSIAHLREGLTRMLDDLRSEDRVSLIAFEQNATVLIDHASGTSVELSDAIASLDASGGTNLYAGLRAAYETVDAHAEDGLQNRVILLSDGETTAGITDDARVLDMSRRYNELGYGLTTIGLGQSFDPTLMRELSEAGAGAFYFLENSAAVQEVFEEEVEAFLIPLATDVRIDLEVSSGYSLRAIYGTNHAELIDDQVAIDIPTVQIAHRTSADDDAAGRRGGGGGMLVELVPRDPSQGSGRVGSLTMSYTDTRSGELVVQEIPVDSALAPGDTPTEGAFDGASVEKSFVMLNIFAGFEMASLRAAYGDDRGALSVLESLAASVRTWLETTDDADIEDDLRYVDRFIANLYARGAAEPSPEQNPPEIWPVD